MDEVHATKIVFPGDKVWSTPVRVKGCYVSGEATYASVLSQASGDRLVLLRGFYDPQPGDAVIGYVSDVKFSGYNVEIFQPYHAFQSSKELRFEYSLGEVIIAKIKEVSETRSVDLEYPKQLKDGRMLNVEPFKVPRIVGRKNSMINSLKDLTGAEIYVGANGVVWFSGKNSSLVIKAINMIREEAHTTGLTERVVKFLQAETGIENYTPRVDEEPAGGSYSRSPGDAGSGSDEGRRYGDRDRYERRERGGDRPRDRGGDRGSYRPRGQGYRR